MINYILSEKGSFNTQDFEQKIDDAIQTISKNENNQMNFEKVRHSPNQAYTINGENYGGVYITFDIIKENKFLGKLNCFFDKTKNFIEITTHEL